MTTTTERLRTFWGERQFESDRLSVLLVRYWEIGLYAAIVSIALGMRLWGLDERAIHHDESLHMYYAWQLFEGRGYEHVPFMHGPLKFFGSALMFRLFGDNDFTGRLLYALVGTSLVGLPYFLRSYIGRLGAIVAALLLAFSPTMVYVSRFNRDDILIVAYTLAMVVVMWRYLKEQQEKYLYFVPLLLMLGFVTMEMTFITTAIFLVYLEYQLANDLLDRYKATRTLTPVEAAVAWVVFLLIGWALALLWPLIEGPRKRWGLDTMPAAANFLVAMMVFALPQFSAAVQKIPLLGLGTPDDPDEGTGHQTLRIITTLGFLFLAGYIGIFWNWRIFVIGSAIFYVPYVLFYTTFFTNMGGFWTGIWGSLDYWLSQQLVRRGSQPDYYYLVTTPVYEFLPLIFGLGGALYYAFKSKLDQVLLATAVALLVLAFSLVPGEAPLLGAWWKLSYVIAIAGILLMQIESFTKFLLFWTLATLFAMGIAGEKMPWLTVHIALPLIMLGAKIVDDILTNVGQMVSEPPVPEPSSAVKRRKKARTDQQEEEAGPQANAASYERYLPLAYCGVLAFLATLIFQRFGPASPLSVVAWLLSLGALGVVAWVARSGAWRLAGQVATVGLFAALFVFTVRASWNAAYDQGTVGNYPQEALIYAQGSPALNVIRDNISQFADETGQGKSLPIVVDSSVNVWPWPWILRDRGYQSTDFNEGYTPPANAVVMVSNANQSKLQPYLADYNEGVPYTHMWWFPEFYKNFTAEPGDYEQDDFLKKVFGGDFFGGWRRYFIDREVRNASAAPDMIAYFPKNAGFTPPDIPGNDPPVSANELPADQITVVGGPGTGAGQFSSPLGIATDGQGSVYVVDSLNHRVQRIRADGSSDAVGEEGGEEGQFGNPRSEHYDLDDGPWGIAVDVDGNVYVADTWNHRVQKFGPDLQFISTWGAGELFGPRDIAVDAEGNILVVDTGNKKIKKYDSEGKLIQDYGRAGAGDGQFNEPSSVALGPDGDIYVADYWNRRIQRFSSSFQYKSQIAVESWGSQGVSDRAYIDILADGRVLATDPANRRIIVFDAQGNEERSWRLGSGAGASRPIGIAASATDVYISDSLTGSVVRVPLLVILSPPAAAPTAVETAGGTP